MMGDDGMIKHIVGISSVTPCSDCCGKGALSGLRLYVSQQNCNLSRVTRVGFELCHETDGRIFLKPLQAS